MAADDVGAVLTKDDIDTIVGGATIAISDGFTRLRFLQTALSGLDAAGIAAKYGYSLGAANVLGSVLSDMVALDDVAHGGTLPGSPTDYWQFAKTVNGIGLK
jgi:hypothetical protein